MAQKSKMSPTATNAAVILCLFKWKDWGLSLTNQFKQAVNMKRDTHILSLPQASGNMRLWHSNTAQVY